VYAAFRPFPGKQRQLFSEQFTNRNLLEKYIFWFLVPNLSVLGVALEEVHEMVEVCVGGLRGVGQVGLLH
jgi:hypothetical protein